MEMENKHKKFLFINKREPIFYIYCNFINI
jgi:hypothetical protein